LTSPATGTVPVRKRGALFVIFWAGLLCGVLDITAAFVTWGLKGIMPVRILQGIAAGLLGLKSFDGGTPTAALGLAFHFLIAFTAAAVFYAASRKIYFLIEHAVLAGVLYGVAVYVVMYQVVLPLSNFHPTHTVSSTVVAICTHIVCVGLPISLVVRHYTR
jgi:uncharacterized membrane protein YagU involved in acid resistance